MDLSRDFMDACMYIYNIHTYGYVTSVLYDLVYLLFTQSTYVCVYTHSHLAYSGAPYYMELCCDVCSLFHNIISYFGYDARYNFPPTYPCSI